MTQETQLRDDMVRFAKSLFDRGYTAGSSGNISARCGDDWLITPTNSCLGFLDPARISKISREGRHLSGDPPSKEVFLHQAFYETRPGTGAVVHLHSTYATLLSCLAETNPQNAIPPLTPYVIMRVGRVPLLPYVPPGDPEMGAMIRALEGRHAGVLLANHGRLSRERSRLGSLCRRGTGGDGKARRPRARAGRQSSLSPRYRRA